MAFEPGVDSMRQAGIPVTVGPYSSGAAGIKTSLEVMSRKMREGMVDAAVQGWAAGVLKASGLDGRSRSTSAIDAQGAALLDALRDQVIYAPDPYGTEQINAAAATLCLRPNLCLNRGDCDDLSVTLGAAALSLGIPVQIVVQHYGGGAQDHVLIVMYDGADWRYADPSTNLPFGSALKAKEETWVDPMGPVGALPESSPQIVSLGKPNYSFGTIPPARFESPQQQGFGSFLGYPTVKDLVDLTSTMIYNMQQIEAAAQTCVGWPNDTAGYTQWMTDYQALLTDYRAAVDYTEKYINTMDVPKWAWDYAVVFWPWDMVGDIINRQVDLDRRFRANGSCAAPTYPNTPQPTGVDPDLLIYNKTGDALKTVQSVAKGAVAPTTLIAGGVVVGGVLVLGALYFLGRVMEPIRR